MAIYEQLNLGAYQHEEEEDIKYMHVKRSFYRAANAINFFLEKLAELIHKRSLCSCYIVCVPVLLWSIQACPLNISDFRSLNIVTDRFFMKLFKTNNINTVRFYQIQFGYQLPIVRRVM